MPPRLGSTWKTIRPETCWRTPLPFPVQVLARVEVIDQISHGKLTTEYRYHHGYWDGTEREFRGFGMVEQLDTEIFADYQAPGAHGPKARFGPVPKKHFSAPLLTKTWFHQGPVDEKTGANWTGRRTTGPGDPQALAHTEAINAFLQTLADPAKGAMPCGPCAAARSAPSSTPLMARTGRTAPTR
jgi:Insecticide toxin TcdB middle/N-terminal region